jgi:predicted PurR-regulated permease PerM
MIAVTSLLLLFKVPYAFLLGFFAGILNFIPYLGSLIAVLMIFILTILTGGFGKAIQVLIPLFVFQQLDANFIEPRIMGFNLKINPLLVIFSVVVGGAYFGVVGMFLAVPIATIIKQLLTQYFDYSEKKREKEREKREKEEREREAFVDAMWGQSDASEPEGNVDNP